MDRLKIFISGTQDDLQPERKMVAETIRALGHEPLMAETYGAQPMSPLSIILEMINRADFYVGVYGARYGSLMDGGISVPEFEFTKFRTKAPRRIIAYVKEIALESKQEEFLKRVGEFKEGYFRQPKFKNTNELAKWIKVDFPNLIDRTRYDIPDVSEPKLGKVYIEQLATLKIPTFGDNTLYLDRAVALSPDLFARTVARYDPRTPERDAKPSLEPLQAALVREKKLVLLGEPGMGKTMSLQHLAQENAQSAQGEIPIYAELKNYGGGEIETLLAQSVNKILAVSGQMLAPDLAESTRILKKWLAQSYVRFLLLLDGLNEVLDPDLHTKVRGELDSLLNSPHRIVVSCREHDYDASLHNRAVAFVLQPLQQDEIREYLQRALGDNGWNLFYAQIFGEEKMETLAGNPLMLWLITLVAKSNPEVHLPENHGKLFQQFVAQMPQLRRQEGIRGLVPLDVVENALAKLGFEMLERNRLTATFSEAYSWEIPMAGKPLDQVLAQAKEWRLLKSDGQNDEPIEFLHQLFQEYFAAIYLNHKLETSNMEFATVLGVRPFDELWHETLVMLAGICKQPVELIKWLTEWALEEESEDVALLACRCWEASEAFLETEATKVVVNALLSAPHSPNSDKQVNRWEAELRISKYAVEHLIVALSNPNVAIRQGAVEILGWTRNSRAIEPLCEALHDPDKIVCCRAATALGTIGDLQAVDPLLVALRDERWEVQKAAAEALGKIGDSRALIELERLALEGKGKMWWSDNVAEVARLAVEEIRKRNKSMDGNG